MRQGMSRVEFIEATGEQPEDVLGNDWGNTISEYSDDDAVEDGELVEFHFMGSMREIDRVTRMAFNSLVTYKNGEVVSDENLTHVAMLAANKAPAGESLIELMPSETMYPDKLWAVENERGKFTLMFPSDY
jgi:hypothetical protein